MKSRPWARVLALLLVGSAFGAGSWAPSPTGRRGPLGGGGKSKSWFSSHSSHREPSVAPRCASAMLLYLQAPSWPSRQGEVGLLGAPPWFPSAGLCALPRPHVPSFPLTSLCVPRTCCTSFFQELERNRALSCLWGFEQVVLSLPFPPFSFMTTVFHHVPQEQYGSWHH